MRRGPLAIVAVVAALLSAAPAASAAITVNTTKDETISGDGTCSLREAVLTVNGSQSPDCAAPNSTGPTTVALAAGTYHLTLGTGLVVLNGIAIQGPGDPTKTVIDADHHDRVLLLDGAPSSIANLTITGGRTRDGTDGTAGTTTSRAGQPGLNAGGGGGIDNVASSLALTNVIVTGNSTGSGGVGGDGFDGATCGAGGAGSDGGAGGGIINGTQLSLFRVMVTNNRTGDGGAGGAGGDNTAAGPGCPSGGAGDGGQGAGIFNDGSLTVASSTIADDETGTGGRGGPGGTGTPGAAGGPGGNGGPGAGIASDGLLTFSVTNSTITGNQTGNGGQAGSGGRGTPGGAGGNGGAGGAGAGLSFDDIAGTGSIVNSTLTLNTAGDGGYGGDGAIGDGASGHGGDGGNGGPGGNGGGLDDARGTLTVTSSTIAANASGDGGNFGAGGFGSLVLGSPGTVGANGTGGGIEVEPAVTLTERDSLVSSNASANCAGAFTDSGHNLSFPDTTCPHAVSGDPKLGPLAGYGGPTQTLALGAGSAAIGQVPATGAGCPSTDQRSVVRPQPAGGPCDIGAYEFAPPSCRPVAASTHGAQPVLVQLSCGDPAGLAVQYAIARRPAHGKLGALSSGKVTYTASSGFSGKDQFTYRAVDLNGTSSLQTVTITVAKVPLVISNAHLSKRRFHVGSGTKFQFTLSLAAQVKATIAHRRHGRTVTLGSVSAHERAGKDSLAFRGQLGGVTLAPGTYSASLVASVSGRRSKPVTLSFVILR